MEKATGQKTNVGRICSVITIFLGLSLVIYMIRVEDEPGLLPLLLVLVGTVWFVINRHRARKHLHRD